MSDDTILIDKKILELANSEAFKVLLTLYQLKEADYDLLSEQSKIPKDNIYKYARTELIEYIQKKKVEKKLVLFLNEAGKAQAEDIINYAKTKERLKYDLNAERSDSYSILEMLHEYFDRNEIDLEVREAYRRGKNIVVVNFTDLIRFNYNLGFYLEEKPEEIIKLIKLAIERKYEFSPFIRFINLTDGARKPIHAISTKDLGKVRVLEGSVRYISKNRPYTHTIKWECPSCGNVFQTKIDSEVILQPKGCGCGRKGNFTEIERTQYDRYYISIEENISQIDKNKQPESFICVVDKEVTMDEMMQKLQVGAHIRVTGIIQRQATKKYKNENRDFKLILKVSTIEPVSDDFGDLQLTKEEEHKIKGIQNLLNQDFDKGFELLCANFAPHILGMQTAKEAIMLQILAGKNQIDPDGNLINNKLHILLVGDPGVGKTQIASTACGMIQNSRMATGPSSTGVSLTAAIRKDEDLGVVVVEAGKVVIASGAICVIDEFDKTSDRDKEMLLSCMSESKIDINKAGIQRTMVAETCILAMANPLHGDFEGGSYSNFLTDLNLHPAIRQRFDLIIPIRETNTYEEDIKIAGRMNYRVQQSYFSEGFSTAFLRKMFNVIRQQTEPEFTEAALRLITKLYADMREAARKDPNNSATTISRRINNSYQRIAKVYAKARGSLIVEEKDVRRAHGLILRSYAWAFEGGNSINMSALYGEEQVKDINKYDEMRTQFRNLYERIRAPIHITVLLDTMKQLGYNVSDVESFIDREKRKGNLMEVKPEEFAPVR